MKKYLISFIKRIIGIVVFFTGGALMVVPYTLVFIFLGIDSANKMMDKIALYFINLLE